MKSIYSLVGVFLPLTALASQAATTTSTREVTCGITFQTSVLRNQDASKSRFDKLNIYADNFGGGGSLDALAGKRLGNQFCFNGTHLGESQQTMDNGLLLMVPEDKTSAWNRVVITGYAMGRPSGQTETGHWGASPRVPLGYLKTRPEPWAGWAGFMGKSCLYEFSRLSCFPSTFWICANHDEQCVTGGS